MVSCSFWLAGIFVSKEERIAVDFPPLFRIHNLMLTLTFLHFGSFFCAEEPEAPKTECELLRERAMASSPEAVPAAGRFVPQCDAEGRYLPQQVRQGFRLVSSVTVELRFTVFSNGFSATVLPDTAGALTAGDRSGREPGLHLESHK